MRSSIVKLCLAAALVGFAVVGCGKNGNTDATQPLLHSFANADSDTKQAIQSVADNLKSHNYVEVVKLLVPLTERLKLTPDEKQALALTLKQINEATKTDPNFDTREMYDLQNRLFHAVYKN